jgi:hypothetical protein
MIFRAGGGAVTVAVAGRDANYYETTAPFIID